MENLSFNEEPVYAQRATAKQSFLTRMAYATGLAHTEDEASYVLLGTAVLIIIVAIGIFVFSRAHPLPAQTPDSIDWPKPIHG